MTEDSQNGAKEIVSQLCEIINKAKITPDELLEILPLFLYKVGFAISDYSDPPKNEELLMDYAKNPTISNALMAQAIFMKENWKHEDK
jgi:hypothetical protein